MRLVLWYKESLPGNLRRFASDEKGASPPLLLCLMLSRLLFFALLAVSPAGAQTGTQAGDGFTPLFNGKNLDGWRASDQPGTFTVQDGAIVVHGPRSHLFYVGDFHGADFKNFHLRAQVMTFPEANSGVYFHTAWQPAGWPAQGFEVQVNNSHPDPKRTAGLYDVADTLEAPAADGQWFTLEIIVQDRRVVTKVDGKVIIDWTQTGDAGPRDHPGRVLSHGAFALQGHDPGSKVLYKNIEVKPLD